MMVRKIHIWITEEKVPRRRLQSKETTELNKPELESSWTANMGAIASEHLGSKGSFLQNLNDQRQHTHFFRGLNDTSKWEDIRILKAI